jgi:site-specific DNA-methyltransferase (adenine-specific)
VQKTDTQINIEQGDALEWYDHWPRPTVIISDGPYGVKGYPGDPPTPDELASWYEAHIATWSRHATPQTTLWFWNTEIGWATVHPVLARYGWEYRACHIWDKGLGHVAGNSNTQSLRKLPIVTEVCVQYVKKAYFEVEGRQLTMQEWLRHEWLRTGLPLSKTNEACGVKNAATRKYFTRDHLWYFPPPEAFQQLADYANQHGDPAGRPYFSVDGVKPLSGVEWEGYRAKFDCPLGVTNVWQEPTLNGHERIKIGNRALHLNQKPLKLMELIIAISSVSRRCRVGAFWGTLHGCSCSAESWPLVLFSRTRSWCL